MDDVKILIVDDEIETRDAIKNNFKRFAHCRISIADNGKEAVEKIKNVFFDLVILDLKMPGINGLDVIKKVKKEKNFPDILVLTAWDSVQIAEEVIKEGALDYIPKPIELETLRMKVKDVLGKKGICLEE